jgi:hypothetical protein
MAPPLCNLLNCHHSWFNGGKLGWVLTTRTRHEYIRVGSGRDIHVAHGPDSKYPPQLGHIVGNVKQSHCYLSTRRAEGV